MSNSDDLRFECVHCGKCCTDINTLVNTTYLDILRIKNGLNLTQDEVIEVLGFYVFGKKPTPKEIERMVVPPIETERGLAFVGLKKKKNGRCYFYSLKKKRCSIYRFRPDFCKTFPFTFKILVNIENSSDTDIKITFTEKGLQYCQGIGEKAPVIEKKNWILLGRNVLQDLAKNTVLIQKWNESIRNKIILPTVRNYILTIFDLGG
ncbi:MAG: YkgJ family cysteine cluster protein [Promethearchaeota archaeon]|jgi:Fe-S-cluster containining protein